jgi:hypothetical protein
MGDKSSSKTTTQTHTQAREALKTAAERLSAREEKAVRMRSGAGIDLKAPLPRRGTRMAETQAELTALEIELRRKLKERNGHQPVLSAKSQEEAGAVPQVRTRAKDKIIRALRRLK